MTSEDLQRARAEGYAAGQRLDPPSPNPYAPAHVPEWAQPRRPREALHALTQRACATALAAQWRIGHQAGMAAYGQQRGLQPPVP